MKRKDGPNNHLVLIFFLLILIQVQNVHSQACYDNLPVTKLTTSQDWIQASIDRHNFYRAKHQVDPLKYNEKLSEIAQEWANNLAARQAFGHSHYPCIGENLAVRGSSNPFDLDPNFAVDGWYAEIKHYDFKIGESKGGVTGHLTQMLWKDSKEVGVAFAKYEKIGSRYRYHTVIVANYYPPGNIIGQNIQNVFPNEGTSSSTAHLKLKLLPGLLISVILLPVLLTRLTAAL